MRRRITWGQMEMVNGWRMEKSFVYCLIVLNPHDSYEVMNDMGIKNLTLQENTLFVILLPSRY